MPPPPPRPPRPVPPQPPQQQVAFDDLQRLFSQVVTRMSGVQEPSRELLAEVLDTLSTIAGSLTNIETDANRGMVLEFRRGINQLANSVKAGLAAVRRKELIMIKELRFALERGEYIVNACSVRPADENIVAGPTEHKNGAIVTFRSLIDKPSQYGVELKFDAVLKSICRTGNDEWRQTLRYEAAMYELFAEKLLRARKCPNMVAYVGSGDCQVTGSVLERAPHLAGCQDGHFTVLITRKIEDAMTLGEAVGRDTPRAKALTPNDWGTIYFQIIWILACLQTVDARQSDAHPGNWLIETLEVPVNMTFRFSGETPQDDRVYYMEIRRIVYLFDFDRGYAPALGNNPLLASGNLYDRFGVGNWTDPNFDLYTIAELFGFPPPFDSVKTAFSDLHTRGLDAEVKYLSADFDNKDYQIKRYHNPPIRLRELLQACPLRGAEPYHQLDSVFFLSADDLVELHIPAAKPGETQEDNARKIDRAIDAVETMVGAHNTFVGGYFHIFRSRSRPNEVSLQPFNGRYPHLRNYITRDLMTPLKLIASDTFRVFFRNFISVEPINPLDDFTFAIDLRADVPPLPRLTIRNQVGHPTSTREPIVAPGGRPPIPASARPPLPALPALPPPVPPPSLLGDE